MSFKYLVSYPNEIISIFLVKSDTPPLTERFINMPITNKHASLNSLMGDELLYIQEKILINKNITKDEIKNIIKNEYLDKEIFVQTTWKLKRERGVVRDKSIDVFINDVVDYIFSQRI